MRKFVLLTLLLVLNLQVIAVSADTMTVSFLNRPPYYFVEHQKPVGLLVDRARNIFNTAGIKVNFIQRPPKRILRGLKQPGNNYCSIGWFKNVEREAFAKFSDPIYQNKPIEVLIRRDTKSDFIGYESLSDIFENRKFKFGSIEDFSYGEKIDQLIALNLPNTYKISGEQKQLIGLLSKRRISFLLIAPEETETLIHSANLSVEDFFSIHVNDIPIGNKRYIMCNKHVSDSVMNRINIAIRSDD